MEALLAPLLPLISRALPPAANDSARATPPASASKSKAGKAGKTAAAGSGGAAEGAARSSKTGALPAAAPARSSKSGAAGDANEAAAIAGPPLPALLLLLDVELCGLPWEALPAIAHASSGVTRCPSLALLRVMGEMAAVGPAAAVAHAPEEMAAASAAAAAAAGPAAVDLVRMSCIADPWYEQSTTTGQPGGWAAPPGQTCVQVGNRGRSR